MNERINQFIKQSYVTVQSPSGEGYTHFSQEKFAELIVRECADLANEGFGSANFGLGIKGQNLKDHFGVQE